jgi:hypothetical protein
LVGFLESLEEMTFEIGEIHSGGVVEFGLEKIWMEIFLRLVLDPNFQIRSESKINKLALIKIIIMLGLISEST